METKNQKMKSKIKVTISKSNMVKSETSFATKVAEIALERHENNFNEIAKFIKTSFDINVIHYMQSMFTYFLVF